MSSYNYNNSTIGFAVGDRKATTTADGQKPAVIMQQITVSPMTRRSSDLTDWRNANKAAEGLLPRRTYLYDLYHDYGTTDAQIIAVWEKRLEPLLSAQWEYTDKDGQIVEDIQQLLDCNGFEDLLRTIMGSKKDGYKMCEPTFFVNDNDQHEFSLCVVPNKNMRPELGVIAYDHLTDNGINIREGIYAKTVMEFGKVDDLGLMLSACMYAILKRGNLSDWAEFIEIFGRGIVDATWDGFDPKQRQELAKAIQEMGGGGVIIRPVGTTVDIKNNTGNANGDLQDKFTVKMDAYISKLFLGSTETTDSSKSSGYAQSQTHQEQQNQKAKTDLNFVRRYLNSRFIKVLKAAGFDTRGGSFVIKETKKLDKEAFDVYKAMCIDLNIPIDDDFFYENFGVRKPDNYEALKKAANDAKNADLAKKTEQENADTPPASKGKKDKKPADEGKDKSTKLSFWDNALRLFQSASVSATPVAGATHHCGERHTIKLASFVADKVFEDLKGGLIKRAYDAQGEFHFDADLFNYTAKTLTSGFIKGWKAQPVKLMDLGFDYGFDDPATLTAFEMNLFRFAGVKTLYEAQQLNELFRNAKSFKEFYDTASSMLTVHNRTWLESEYNTANASGESASTYARLLKQAEVFPYWQYKTVMDDKVRHSHMLLHDIVLPYDHPYWKFIMPPNDWNCRCFIVPRTKAEVTDEQIKLSEARVKAYLASTEYKRAKKGGWGINRADKGLVFTENQHYTSDYLDATKQLNGLGAADYSLESLKTIFEKLSGADMNLKHNAEQTAEAEAAFFDGLEKAGKKYLLGDVAGRELTINKATVTGNTYHLELVKNALVAPDEVWLNNAGAGLLNKYVYVKYFKGKALAVISALNDDLSLEVQGWQLIDNEKLRKGLLIKN
jgi:phage gp29-like protein